MPPSHKGDTVTITELLNYLAELQATADLYRMKHEDMRAEIMAPVKQQLTDLDAEFAPMFEAVNEQIAATTEQVKAAVIANGASVKGAHLQAVYAKGRTSWDSRGLDGYAVAHPEINAFRSVGQPSVSIRKGGDA